MKAMFMNYFKDRKLYQWDISKETYLISNTEIDGEFCLDQTNMNTLLKFDNPKLTLQDGVLKVQNGKVKANLKLSKEELILPNLEFEETFKINVDKIKIASKFVDKTGNKPILSGVYVGNDYVAATDSYSCYRVPCENKCNLILSNNFAKLISNLTGELEFKCNKNIIACECLGVMYIGRLIEGSYPNLNKLYEGNRKNNAVLDKQELKKFLAYEDNKNSYVILDENKIVINDLNTDKNYNFEIEVKLDITDKVCLSYEKLINVINCIEGDEIRIKFDGVRSPLLINEEFIVLPCVIAEEDKKE